ncbi:hypothetical protein [Pseudomonas indica]|uniref:Tail terminator n=1 Tax=Pseudomonas indica TaxID=137658 RepID=A0A1G8V4Z9_9PSED|nr:hypothetical protein [Pseudomonas indica]SDJ61148.1 hypothetical protein SAMN05216186_102100 [Pseudomonas indica]
MKPNILTECRKALLARLGTIQPANGYRTNLGGNVRSGWFNEVIKQEGVGYPLVVVQKGRAREPQPGPGAIKVSPGFMLVAAVEVGLDDYEDALDDLEHDLLQCLIPLAGVFHDWMPRGVLSVSVGASQSFPPGDGLMVATVAIPVHIQTVIQARHPNA